MSLTSRLLLIVAPGVLFQAAVWAAMMHWIPKPVVYVSAPIYLLCLVYYMVLDNRFRRAHPEPFELEEDDGRD